MKKTKMIAAALVCVLMATPVTGFADTFKKGISESGGMNVDYLLNQSRNQSMYSASALPADKVEQVGGGTFTVKWWYEGSSQAFSSKYEHATKEHKSSVTGQQYLSSGFVPKGVMAYVWTYAKTFGNKANWETR